MLKSMTGFGRYEIADEEKRILVEIKAVNHRYCDISIRMPRRLNFLETRVRSLLKEYVQRGKIDVFLSYEDFSENRIEVQYHEEIAKEYVQMLQRISRAFQIEDGMNAYRISKYPEVVTLEEQSVDEEKVWSILEDAVRRCVQKLVDERINEGRALKNDLIEKLDRMSEDVACIEKRFPEVVAAYREKLEDKVSELLEDKKLEEGLIASEIVLFSDKICVDEETVRLRSHIENMKSVLKETAEVGRKLDFIAQEMNREANTILSKANDLEISNKAIDLKTEIEKVREQIQNIE